MQTLFIISGAALISLGFIIYKKVAEPITLYLINESIRIPKDEYEEVQEENRELEREIEKLDKAIKGVNRNAIFPENQ